MAGVAGSWARSVDSIRIIKELGAEVVAVIVLTRHNVEQVAETLDFIASLGVRRVMINRYNIGGRGVTEPLSVSAGRDRLHRAYEAIERKVIETGLKITSNVCSPHCLLNPADYPHIGFGNCSPDPARRPITLDAEGNIRLCNHSPVVAGNIFEQTLEEILHSPYSLSWGETVPSLCADCDKWSRCLGGCRAASEQCGGTLADADPVIAALL
jgi:radical SAM protein with 4Fe4S-binding SPASM domain